MKTETIKLVPKHLAMYKVFGEPAGPHYAHYDLVGGRLVCYYLILLLFFEHLLFLLEVANRTHILLNGSIMIMFYLKRYK